MHRASPSSLRRLAASAMVVLLAASCGATTGATSQPSAPAATSQPSVAAAQVASMPIPTVAASPVDPASPSPVAVLPGEPWLLYQRWTAETGAKLRLVRPDGSDDHPFLPDVADEQLHPDWSPDGRHVAFVVAADPQVIGGDLWVADATGGEARRLVQCTAPCVMVDSPAWSPDGRSIAYVTADAVGGTAPTGWVKAVDLATGAARTLLTTKGPEYPFNPRWGPGGRSLVVELDRFASTKVDDGTPIGSAIAVVNLDAGAPQLRVLTAWSSFGAYPDWSSVAGLIVFSTYDLGTRDAGAFRDPSPPSDLYSIKPDGSGLRQITHNPSGATLIRNRTASGPLSSQPTWAPDGTAIVFVQVTGDVWPGWAMATIRSDGTGLAPAIGTAYVLGTHPRFRPGN